MNKYQDYLQELQDLEYEAKFKNKNGKNKKGQLLGQIPGSSQIAAAKSNNYTTNYSSNNNMPNIQSGSLQNQQSESIINVAVGESVFVNSNVGITIDKH